MRILILLAVCTLGASAAPAEWPGETKLVDGVTTVVNPETPADGETVVELEELWRVGDDDEGLLIGTIAELLHDDDGNIYALDGQLSEIQVFAPDGSLLRTIGRQGEGPGEFANGADMFWAPGGQLAVIQSWPGKIVQIRPDGTPGEPFPLPFRDGGGFQMATRGVGVGGNRSVISGTAWTTADGQQLQFIYLKAFDAERNELATYHESSRETRFGGWNFREENFVDFQRRWHADDDGRVAAALSFDDYSIHVWQPDGSIDRVITRPGYRSVERSDDEKAVFQTLYERFTRWNPNSTFEVSRTHQTITQVVFREDASLWVQSGFDTFRGEPGAGVGYDVYDREGRYTRRVKLLLDADPAADGLFFVGDRVYVVTDLLAAVMARFAAGDETADAEPVSIIAYRIPADGLEVSALEP